MKKFFKVFFLICAIAAAFGLGFGSKLLLDGFMNSDAVEEDPAPTLRIYDATVQWSDGVRWHIFGDADELAAQDPVAIAAQKLEDAAAAGTTGETDTEEVTDEAADSVLALNRGTGSVVTYYAGSGGGGGYAGGGGGGGSDGQDIAWSGDYL